MTVPSGSCRSNQPQNVLSRWCFRHRHPRFDAQVGPTGYGMVWSKSQRYAGSSQPGNRHVRSRQRTNIGQRRATARSAAPAARPRDGSSGRILAVPATLAASSGAGMIPPPITTAGFVRGGPRNRAGSQRLGDRHLPQRLRRSGPRGFHPVQLHRRVIGQAALLGNDMHHHRAGLPARPRRSPGQRTAQASRSAPWRQRAQRIGAALIKGARIVLAHRRAPSHPAR